MRTNLRKLIAVLLLNALTTACNDPAPIELTTEQSVYETLFLEIVGDMYSKFYVADATESEWFAENPIEGANWESYLKGLGGISLGLVEELYRVNNQSYPLGWQPILTNAELLPADYAFKPKREQRDSRCLVENGKGNVGVSKPGKGEYRAYYTVSRVAFSSGRRKALIKYSRYCAPLSGAGEFFVVFEFKDGRWQIIGGRVLWIS